jgi:hypothetical protein
MALYYLDGSTLSDSTAVYTDVGLTVCAADGFYSDNTIVRELANCVLLPAQACPSCNVPCSSRSTISLSSGGPGIYRTDFNVGNTGALIGAIVVEFSPDAVPDGIRALYNTVVYNKLSSPVDGYHASTTSGNFTFIGATASDCGISGGKELPPIDEYNYSYINTQFEATGNTQSLTVAAGDVSLSSTAPGACIMVIPKLTANPDLLNISVVSPCTTNEFTIKVHCPRLLTSILSTDVHENKVNACATEPTISIYNAPVNGTDGVPGLYDWIFFDGFGLAIASDGFYKLDSGAVIKVSNGVVVILSTC